MCNNTKLLPGPSLYDVQVIVGGWRITATTHRWHDTTFPLARVDRGRFNQRGFSLILVLFLLVVVSLLAAAMAQLNRGGSAAVSEEIQSTRALFAAESGAQIAAMKIFPIGSTGSCNSFTRSFSTDGLNNCSAAVTCSTQTTNIDGTAYTLYKVESSGVCGSGDDYARRKITVELRDTNE